jgi:hypothetical protein
MSEVGEEVSTTMEDHRSSPIQDVTKRGDHTKAGMLFLGAFGFPTLSFVAAILAALSSALLFVRGAIVGVAKLLGLGFGLSGFAGDVGREALAVLVVGLLAPLVLILLEFVFATRRTDVERVPATDAGRRVRPFRLELEGVRLTTGGLWWRTNNIVGSYSSKDAETDSQLVGGGAVSFKALSAALRLVLGATVGILVLETEMVSLRL